MISASKKKDGFYAAQLSDMVIFFCMRIYIYMRYEKKNSVCPLSVQKGTKSGVKFVARRFKFPSPCR